jgi:L-2-hydroxyglutarate oxidase
MNNTHFDFIVVGGGIVGAATAYKLQLKFPGKTIAILEKEKTPAFHQTGRNSGVIHSGIYYKPGSLKALNCNSGRDQLVQFAVENNIKHRICGKIIVATKKEELLDLERIYKNGLKNNTKGIQFLNGEEIKEKEPFINGIKAVWVPSAGIIDYAELTEKLIEKVRGINAKSKLITNCKVQNRDRKEDRLIVLTDRGTFSAEKIIFCTGLQSDRMAKKDKLKIDMQIVGFRGDYYKFKDHAKNKINNLVYPVPDPKYPFLGVHYTPMINGDVECGPNAVFTFKREGYKKTSFSLMDSLQAFSFEGTWKLFFKNWRKGIEEYRRAFSKGLFVKELQKMMPSISENDIEFSRSGVRAQAVDLNGNMIDDFKIINHDGITHVINAPSPAATACLSIADEIIFKIFEVNTTSIGDEAEQNQ